MTIRLPSQSPRCAPHTLPAPTLPQRVRCSRRFLRGLGGGLLLAAGLAACGEPEAELVPTGQPVDVVAPRDVMRFPGYSLGRSAFQDLPAVVTGANGDSWLYVRAPNPSGATLHLHRLWGEPTEPTTEQIVPVVKTQELFGQLPFTLLAQLPPAVAGAPGRIALIQPGVTAASVDLPPGDNEVDLFYDVALAWPKSAPQRLTVVQIKQGGLQRYEIPFPADVAPFYGSPSLSSVVPEAVHYISTDGHVRAIRYTDGTRFDLGVGRLRIGWRGNYLYTDPSGELLRSRDLAEGGVPLGIKLTERTSLLPVGKDYDTLLLCDDSGLRAADLSASVPVPIRTLDASPCASLNGTGPANEVWFQRRNHEFAVYIVPLDGSQPPRESRPLGELSGRVLENCGEGRVAYSAQQNPARPSIEVSDIWLGGRLHSTSGRRIGFLGDCQQLVWIEVDERSPANPGTLMLAELPDGGRTVLGRDILDHQPISQQRLVAITGPGSSSEAGALLIDPKAGSARRLLSTSRSYRHVIPVTDSTGIRPDMVFLDSLLPGGDARPELTIVRIPR